MWNEVIVACLNVLSQNLFEGTEENHEKKLSVADTINEFGSGECWPPDLNNLLA
jgi:hypothetical protein